MSLPPVYILSASRTPFGTFGGSLASLSATVLGAHAAKHALAKAGIPAEQVGSSIWGNVIQSANDAPYIARHIGRMAGLPIEANANTINRLCGSGFQSVIQSTHEIRLGDVKASLAGGTENMSQAPFALRSVRWGTKYGKDLVMDDTLAKGLVDTYPEKTPMGITGENLATKYNITREACDEWALESQKRWAKANAAKIFEAEMAPIELKGRKETILMTEDEHPRPKTTKESLAKLKPVFKEGGVVTAGNASGINDGAGAVVLAGQELVDQYNLKPLAKIIAYKAVGVDPKIMGIGPVPAIQSVLKQSGLTLADIDIVEVNEAFCSQFLSVAKELGLNMAKTNMSGGATAIGHPLGASGSRIMAHITHALVRTGGRYAIGSACIGGGQGVAILIENVSQ